MKRLKQDAKRRIGNRIVRGHMRRLIKNFREETDHVKMNDMLPAVFSAIDHAAKKNVIHKNTASRYKSRLAKHLKKVQEEIAS